MSTIEKGSSNTSTGSNGSTSTTSRLSTAYGRAEVRIEEMVAYRAPFHRIEEFIDGLSDLTGEERAALWMLAWATGNGWRSRRRIMFGD